MPCKLETVSLIPGAAHVQNLGKVCFLRHETVCNLQHTPVCVWWGREGDANAAIQICNLHVIEVEEFGLQSFIATAEATKGRKGSKTQKF